MEQDPRLGLIFICVTFALVAAIVQLLINTGKGPPQKPPRLPPGEYPLFPMF